MGSIGPAEILVVLVVALIVLGPSRLPDAAKSLGRALSEFRRMSSGLQAEVRDVFSEPPTYPKSQPGGGGQDGRPQAGLPSSPEQAEVTVVREPDPPPSA